MSHTQSRPVEIEYIDLHGSAWTITNGWVHLGSLAPLARRHIPLLSCTLARGSCTCLLVSLSREEAAWGVCGPASGLLLNLTNP